MQRPRINGFFKKKDENEGKMYNFFKKSVPRKSRHKDVIAADLWIVSWRSRYGEYSSDIKKEYIAFTVKKDAEGFAQSLRDAFKLLKHTSGNIVNLEKGRG